MLRQIFSSQVLFRRLFFCNLILIVLLGITKATMANTWRPLATGIEYLDLGPSFLSPWSHIHAFQIDLTHNQFELVTARSMRKSLASAREFGSFSHALIAINGGFFDDESRPLGLRISQHQQHHSLKPISWWGVFYIQNKQARIASFKQFKLNNQVEFAIQSGPRLLVNGKIMPLKDGYAERTAVGITKSGKVIILVTQNAPITTTLLAQIMRSELHCTHAINLDGGASSQLYAKIGSFRVNVRGYSKVSDAVVVKPAI